MRSHSSARWLRYCDGHEIAARISARLDLLGTQIVGHLQVHPEFR
jgi:hypothetical protein